MKKTSFHCGGGFTLIELMIVVAIVGVLAAVGVPAYKQYTLKSRFAHVVAAAKYRKNDFSIAFSGDDGTSNFIQSNALVCGDTYTGPFNTTHNSLSIPGTSATYSIHQWQENCTITGRMQDLDNPADPNGIEIIFRPTLDSASGSLTWTAEGGCYGRGLC